MKFDIRLTWIRRSIRRAILERKDRKKNPSTRSGDDIEVDVRFHDCAKVFWLLTVIFFDSNCLFALSRLSFLLSCALRKTTYVPMWCFTYDMHYHLAVIVDVAR